MNFELYMFLFECL